MDNHKVARNDDDDDDDDGGGGGDDGYYGDDGDDEEHHHKYVHTLKNRICVVNCVIMEYPIWIRVDQCWPST